MAKLDKMPSQATISSLAGILDFYVWKGIPCVRSWPKKPPMPRSPAVQASGAAFGQLARDLSDTAPAIVAFATHTASQSNWTWKDLLTSAQYGHVFTWS